VELDAVEPRRTHPVRRRGEQIRQTMRQLPNMLLPHIRHPLAESVAKRLELTLVEHSLQLVRRHAEESLADLVIAPAARYRAPVSIGNSQIASEVLFGLGPPPDGQEIDQLDEEPRATTAGPANRFDQFRQARNETIVSDTQQRTARHVANTGRLDDNRTRLPGGETRVPGEDLRCHQTVFRCSPRHHGRHPGPLDQLDRPDATGREEARAQSLVAGRPTGVEERVLEALRRLPHAQGV